MPEVENLSLHDSVLESINFNWASKVVVIEARTSEGMSKISFANCLELNVPQQNPWGFSVSINKIEKVDSGFEVEMQSGDVIKIRAESIHVST